ncbi:hypothetical protein CVT26_014572 [Gymnopilus dilepis]|uniref:MARVEL domain-containing protein n=1 Tax=Gymnopilus dilepis TaxID=231916 RepID=A0A409W310_9AGAR|nr:hypothetical protein CVT26_014572 [Gymnopilus dilepis]
MTVRFGNHRLAFYIFVLLSSGVVLGLAANFANEFLPGHNNKDFTIFALIIPSLTIFTFLLTLQWATPQIEAIALFILGVLWLAMGAWSTDVIGPQQCDVLGGHTIPAKGNNTANAQAFCYEMKVIQAFSWALFCVFVIALVVLIQLVSLAQQFGRYLIWTEPIRELPWFGEMPGYYNTSSRVPNSANMYYPPPSAGGYGYPYQGGMPMPQPGNSIIIQPNPNGGPPTITQVPLSSIPA